MLKNAEPVQQIQRILIAQGFFDVSVSHNKTFRIKTTLAYIHLR